MERTYCLNMFPCSKTPVTNIINQVYNKYNNYNVLIVILILRIISPYHKYNDRRNDIVGITFRAFSFYFQLMMIKTLTANPNPPN